MACQVHFRFYEELNLFLKTNHRNRAFSISFHGFPSVKDAIESLGVPHTEVDLILVNGISSDFSCRLKNKDRVAVYPVYESLDISGLQHLRKRALRDPRFILDVHLGKLARYLRMAGFNCRYDTTFTDEAIIRIACDEGRIILTRDKGILKNGRVTRGLYVWPDDPEQQFAGIVHRLQLEPLFHTFSRCIRCNEAIVRVEKSAVLDQLNPLTRKHFSVFYRCTGCGRVYWEGSHVDRMNAFIGKITAGYK